MRAGAEGQTGIEANNHCGRVNRRLDRGRIDPQALPEAHRLVVVHPCPRPVAIVEARKTGAAHDRFRQFAVQRHQQIEWIAFDRKQRLQGQVRPQRRFARRRFQYRIVLGVGQRLRQRAGLIEGLFDHGMVGGFETEMEFEPGHFESSEW